MKPAKKTTKTLLDRVLLRPTPNAANEVIRQAEAVVVAAQAAKAVEDAGISPEHAPHVAQLISTSLSTQSSLTRETY